MVNKPVLIYDVDKKGFVGKGVVIDTDTTDKERPIYDVHVRRPRGSFLFLPPERTS